MTHSPGYFELATARGMSPLVTSPRERDLLNIMQRQANLMSANCILDLSQSIGRSALRTDGLVPTLGTSCGRLFSPAHGTFLDPVQCLLLQGCDIDVTENTFSKDELFSLAGNAMCVPVVGCVMAAALALL